jgi:hypothetical protein
MTGAGLFPMIMTQMRRMHSEKIANHDYLVKKRNEEFELLITRWMKQKLGRNFLN